MTPTGTRQSVAVGLITLAVLAALTAAGVATVPDARAATQDEERAALTTPDVTLEPGESTTVDVVLTSAPEGLAGFEITVELASGGVAAVTNATYPDRYGLTTEPAIGAKQQSVALEAADLSNAVEPGATEVRLATLTLSGEGAGESRIEAVEVQIDGDEGTRVQPDRQAGIVTVGDQAGESGSDTAAPDTGASDGSATSKQPGADSGTDGSEESRSAIDPALGMLGGVVGLAVVLGLTLALRRSRQDD